MESFHPRYQYIVCFARLHFRSIYIDKTKVDKSRFDLDNNNNKNCKLNFPRFIYLDILKHTRKLYPFSAWMVVYTAGRFLSNKAAMVVFKTRLLFLFISKYSPKRWSSTPHPRYFQLSLSLLIPCKLCHVIVAFMCERCALKLGFICMLSWQGLLFS